MMYDEMGGIKVEKLNPSPGGVAKPEPEREPKPKRSPVRRIDIFRAWCKGCGICVAFCPKGVLAIDEAGYPYVKDLDACTGCGWCEIRCPDFAITVERRRKRRESGRRDEEKASE
jgi:2-oxoglutarate ferredoxin oxidoreductase subunit delta